MSRPIKDGPAISKLAVNFYIGWLTSQFLNWRKYSSQCRNWRSSQPIKKIMSALVPENWIIGTLILIIQPWPLSTVCCNRHLMMGFLSIQYLDSRTFHHTDCSPHTVHHLNCSPKGLFITRTVHQKDSSP